ncbi:MAG: hypothetical protein ACYDEJ_03480 [Desulfitobacteriaceae bacterium]
MTKKELCHQLALEFAKMAITHPEKLAKDERFDKIPALNQSTRRDFAWYYSDSFDWFYENFETYIGTRVLSDTED